MHGPRDLTRDRELDMTENFAAQQASLHEDHHWLQWIGTSIGLFLTAVRFSQEQTAGLLCELPRHCGASCETDALLHRLRPSCSSGPTAVSTPAQNEAVVCSGVWSRAGTTTF